MTKYFVALETSSGAKVLLLEPIHAANIVSAGLTLATQIVMDNAPKFTMTQGDAQKMRLTAEGTLYGEPSKCHYVIWEEERKKGQK